MKQDGFSLIELTVVLGIISILLTVATLSYNDWQVKYNVEKQTKELVADFNSLRIKAVYSKTVHRAEISTEEIVFKRSGSETDETFDEDDNVIVERKALRYKLKNEDGSEFSPTNIDFDSRGFTTNLGATIRIDSPKNNAAFDCVIIAVGRTNMGKIENEACVPK